MNDDAPGGRAGNSGMSTYRREEGVRAPPNGKTVFKHRRFFPTGLFYLPYGNVVWPTNASNTH